MKRELGQELSQFAASHELDGERRTADVLRRAEREIVRQSRLLAEIKANQDNTLSSLLLALLDRVELEEDHTLAGQRHQIARDCGYEVVFGKQVSGEQH